VCGMPKWLLIVDDQHPNGHRVLRVAT